MSLSAFRPKLDNTGQVRDMCLQPIITIKEMSLAVVTAFHCTFLYTLIQAIKFLDFSPAKFDEFRQLDFSQFKHLLFCNFPPDAKVGKDTKQCTSVQNYSQNLCLTDY